MEYLSLLLFELNTTSNAPPITVFYAFYTLSFITYQKKRQSAYLKRLSLLCLLCFQLAKLPQNPLILKYLNIIISINYNEVNFWVVSLSCSVTSVFLSIASDIFLIPPTISCELVADWDIACELSSTEVLII